MSNSTPTLHLDRVIEQYAQDMTGKVVAITGTTSGTGFICARELAKQGATVILLNRESSRSTDALSQLKSAVPNAKFDAIACDLQDFDSVREAAKTIHDKYKTLEVLVNNAGVMALPDQATKDGYDVQMQTNVLSHFLLTKELFPLLKNSSESRIVNHTSMARLGGPLIAIYFEQKAGSLGGDESPNDTHSFRGPRWERYHQTKLANCAFTYGLKNKLEDAGISHIIPLIAHPGLAKTNLQVTTAKAGGMDLESEMMKKAQSSEDGATGIIRASMDPSAKAGDFYGPVQGWSGFPELLTPEDYLMDESNLKVNWLGCEKAVGAFVIE